MTLYIHVLSLPFKVCSAQNTFCDVHFNIRVNLHIKKCKDNDIV